MPTVWARLLRNWTSGPICGSLIATFRATRHARLPGSGRHVAADRFYLTWLRLPGRGRALGAGEVKFTGEVGPDVKLVTYEIDIKRVIKRKLNMAIGDARLLADGKEIYVANDLRVGLFLREGDAKGTAA